MSQPASSRFRAPASGSRKGRPETGNPAEMGSLLLPTPSSLLSLLLILHVLLHFGLCDPSSGKVCMTVEPFRPAENSSRFYECSPLGKEEVAGYELSDRYLGVWQLRDCPDGNEFDEPKQKCVDRKTFRRQQATCGINPTENGCLPPCTAASAIPIVGAPCNWMSSPLVRDPASSNFFLQCGSQSGGASCGEWRRIPCASNTVFDPVVSLCVPSAVQKSSPCGAQQVGVCSCAATGTQNNCPGTTTCKQKVCCMQNDVIVGNFIQNQAPLCPGSNVPPLASCNEQCPQYSSCSEGIGCCPLPVGNINQPMIQISLCPGSYSPPIGQCNNCPSGTLCNQQLKMCCPTATQPSPDVVYNVVLLCPNGSPATTPCSAGCSSGYGCFQGACCPLSCPSGQTAIGFCASGGCGSGKCYKDAGCCCQEVVKLPVCKNGMQSQQRCSVDLECGANMECSNGGCCPMPFCPTGVQAMNRCRGGINNCLAGYSCMDSLCCPLPRCPNGIISLGVCTRSFDCGRPGVECANGACCPLPMCPGNIVSSQRCTSGCTNCCPGGFSCVNGGCCPLPKCPTGQIALSTCSGSCSMGSECLNGGCCPLPRCPTGIMATQRCQMGIGCGMGMQCEGGVCCPIPICSSGSIASSICGMGNACPMGYVCEGRGCCLEPLPLCPNGGRAAQRCNRGAECPPGYGCTPLGACCLLSMEPVCPGRSNAICQCSPNNFCPPGSSCAMGTCCSSGNSLTSFNQVPGTTCQASTQCNGYTNNCAQCLQGVCACTGGAASNGASCLQMPANILSLARNGCDQYGSPCKFVLSTARRRPIFAPTGNITETPLFFNVAQHRKCVANATHLEMDADSTCLPSEKCINGECKMKLWPGEYGCTTDLECSSRCPNTYCEKRKSDKNVAQCQCKDGLLLYGRCFSQCPKGFHESGAYCTHDNEDIFWTEGDAQDQLKDLLNSGTC